MKMQGGGQKRLRAWLENQILDGHLAPGDRIDEQEVCARFGVSRTPVREALMQLSSLDLIEFRPRFGAVVRQMSVKEIAAIWEVLTSLEGLAAALAARRMTGEDLARLQALHGDSRRAMEACDVAGYDDCNNRFHEAIYQGGRNDYLAGQAMTIRRRLQSYRRYPFRRAGGLQRSFTGHQLVVDAILAGDDEAAAAAMRDHVTGGLTFLDLVAELPTVPVPTRITGDGRAPPAAKRSAAGLRVVKPSAIKPRKVASSKDPGTPARRPKSD